MRQEAAEADKEYAPVPIVREVSAFTYEYVHDQVHARAARQAPRCH